MLARNTKISRAMFLLVGCPLIACSVTSCAGSAKDDSHTAESDKPAPSSSSPTGVEPTSGGTVPGPVSGPSAPTSPTSPNGTGMLGCPTIRISGAPVRESMQAPASLSQAFQQTCANCHGAHGEGAPLYPALPGKLSLDDYKTTVRNGRKAMPGFAATYISDAQIEQDYALLRGATAAQPSVETQITWSEERVNQAYHDGLVVWRTPDKDGAACASCHSPDGIDLAAIGYSDAAISRRALLHVSPEDTNRLIDFVHAQRIRFHVEAPCDPLAFRPFQPGGEVLAGSTPAEQDDAFGRELERLALKVAVEKVTDIASAHAAFEELRQLDLKNVKVGVALPRWTEDGFNGDEHRSLNDWIPSEPRKPKSGALDALFALDDAYLADPSEENLRKVDEAIQQPDNMVGTAAPFFSHVMEIKWRSVLLASHFFRMALLGKPGWFEAPRVPFAKQDRVYNPFFKQGVRNKEGVLCGGQCDAAVQSLPAMASQELEAGNAEAQINALSNEIAHPWFSLGQMLDQGLLQTENGSDGTTLNPFYWNLDRFPQDQVQKPFFNAHHVVQQVDYLTRLVGTDAFPKALSDGQRVPAVHPLLSSDWFIVTGLIDPLKSLEARTATSVRLRLNLMRMFLLLQREQLSMGGAVAGRTPLLERLAEWKKLPADLTGALASYPDLTPDKALFTSESLALIDEVAGLILAAPEK